MSQPNPQETSMTTSTPTASAATNKPRRERSRVHKTKDGKWETTAYVSDNAPIPRGIRRVLFDLAPATIETLLVAVRTCALTGSPAVERLLVEALEKSR